MSKLDFRRCIGPAGGALLTATLMPPDPETGMRGGGSGAGGVLSGFCTPRSLPSGGRKPGDVALSDGEKPLDRPVPESEGENLRRADRTGRRFTLRFPARRWRSAPSTGTESRQTMRCTFMKCRSLTGGVVTPPGHGRDCPLCPDRDGFLREEREGLGAGWRGTINRAQAAAAGTAGRERRCAGMSEES